jgi:membrane protease YdiL (CAAX protease family)
MVNRNPMASILANAELIDRVVSHAIVMGGAVLLAVWLLRTSLGRSSLDGSKPRRNGMPLYAPVAAAYFWFVATPLVQYAARQMVGRATPDQETVIYQGVYCVMAIPVVGLILLLAHTFFARGIKGFGLGVRHIPRDLATAGLRLLAIWPLVLAALALVEHIGRARHGDSYQIPEHETLKILTEAPGTAVKVVLVVAAAVLAPIQEELLFRGLLQTTLRSYLNRPWIAIAATSALFAGVHFPNITHMPALFALAMGLGYSYEKSGSLWQPIFMHALFNATAIATALTQ